MLSNLFTNPLLFIIWIISLLVAITIHEASHAFVADRLGDPTAKLAGRLTLNPLAHLDPLGTLFLLIAQVGWGKPVPVDPYNLRNPKRDEALISLAGPISNLTLAVILSILLRIFTLNHNPYTLYPILSAFIVPIIILNVGLGIFNLFPVSPLDGFKIAAGIMPRGLEQQWNELQGYGIIFLLFMLFPIGGGSLLTNIISPIISFVLNLLLPNGGNLI